LPIAAVQRTATQTIIDLAIKLATPGTNREPITDPPYQRTYYYTDIHTGQMDTFATP